MADLSVRVGPFTLRHPVLPGPGPNAAGAAEAMGALGGGAAAVVLQTVTWRPEPSAARTRWSPHGKDGAFHRQPCTAVPFERWLWEEFPDALAAARSAGVPCLPAIGYGPVEVRIMGERLAEAGADGLIYDAHHARREEIAPALTELRGAGIPVIVRLGPHHGEDLADLAAALEPLVEGFCVIGSFGPCLLIDPDSPSASPGVGFLSGSPIRPVAQRFLFELARCVSKPVIAAGGIATGRDAAIALMLGAAAVMVTTAAVARGPAVYGTVSTELAEWLAANGFESAAALQGAYLRRWGGGQRVVTEKEEVPALAAEACITCTFCETVCFYDAIVAPPKHLPTITAAPCFECGLCVSACPTGALSFRSRAEATLLKEG